MSFISKRKKCKSIVSVASAAVLALTFAVGNIGSMNVDAAPAKAMDNTILGNSGIANPVSGNGGWSYVYYGKYNGNPVKYRVLDKASADFGGDTMLLDCDSVLYSTEFRKDDQGSNANIWAYSNIREALNGSEFLNKSGVFTYAEKKAIAGSRKAAASSSDGTDEWARTVYEYNPLTGEQIFLLDAVEATRSAYGYKDINVANSTKVKKSVDGATSDWWIRSNNTKYNIAGRIESDGKMGIGLVTQKTGVSPAFNINRSSILFSTAVSGNIGNAGTEYKLTLIDDAISMKVTDKKVVYYEGATITVPYTISGNDSDNVDQMSVMILDKEYTEGNINGASIKFFGKIATGDTFAKAGEGKFNLPSDFEREKWGVDYFVYAIAEDIHEMYETDYAGKLLKLDAPVVKPADTNQKNKLVKTDKGTQFYKSDGKLAKNEWVTIDKKLYYFKSDGYAAKDEWINGKWVNSDGSCTYEGKLTWKKNATGWWVEDTKGWYPVNSWQKIDGIWYYFNAAGYMASEEYYNGYWFNTDGSWAEKYFLTWKHNSTGWWVEDKSGWWPSSRWLKIDGKWYYFNDKGYMVTNTTIDGYKIGADGACL